MIHPDRPTFAERSVQYKHRIQSPIVDLAITRSLIEIQRRTVLKGPLKGQCRDVSFEVEKETGLRISDGVFLLDHPDDVEGILQRHWWNEDGAGTRIGLTEQQFNPHLNKPFKDGIVILTPENPDYWRYLPLDHPTVWKEARMYYWEKG